LFGDDLRGGEMLNSEEDLLGRIIKSREAGDYECEMTGQYLDLQPMSWICTCGFFLNLGKKSDRLI